MSIYDIIVSMCHDIIHDLYDIMSLDTDIICYIIGYIPVRPEIWSGQVLAALLGTCPIASQCRTPAIKRCPVRSRPLLTIPFPIAGRWAAAAPARCCPRPRAGAARGFDCKIGS